MFCICLNTIGKNSRVNQHEVKLEAKLTEECSSNIMQVRMLLKISDGPGRTITPKTYAISLPKSQASLKCISMHYQYHTNKGIKENRKNRLV